MNGDHFIPFRKADVVALTAGDLPAAERESFLGFTRTLVALMHHRFHERIEVLKDAYHPFNPEADTRTVAQLTPAQRGDARERLEEELAALARAANFTEIDLTELDRALAEHTLLKVRLAVDLDPIDTLMFFRRGESHRVRPGPDLVRPAATDGRVHQLRPGAGLRHVQGRRVLRRQQPRAAAVPARLDHRQALPERAARRPGDGPAERAGAMRVIDKLLIGVPAAISGIVVIVTKLVTSIGLLFLLAAFWLGLRDEPVQLNQTALVSVGAGLIAFGGYLVRQVTKFKNRKILFMKALSENLYFRNLDNDAGVFHHLLDAAEEAEVTEAVLAYHFLHVAGEPLTPSELDGRIEAWLGRQRCASRSTSRSRTGCASSASWNW